jgi:hypothetical protein
MEHISSWSVLIMLMYRTKTSTIEKKRNSKKVGLNENIDKTMYTVSLDTRMQNKIII